MGGSTRDLTIRPGRRTVIADRDDEARRVLVNTACSKICDRDAIVRALESSQLAGYAGDVWFLQPAPTRPSLAHHAPPRHDPHVSGSSLSGQARYAAGTREILECWFSERPIREAYLIVEGGRLAGAGAHSCSARETATTANEGAHD